MKLKKILAAVLAGGMLFCGGTAVTNAASDADKLAFREAYLKEKGDDSVFRQGIDFFGPAFHGEFEGTTLLLRDASVRVSGMINWEYTDLSTDRTINENVPVYVAQNGEDMILYAQRRGRWSRMMLPAVPVGIANAIKTSNVNVLNQNMSAVKSVDIIQDTKEQRVMNITLDGKKLADLMREYSNTKLSSLSASEQAEQKDFADHLFDALQTTDVVCAWAVKKDTWKTMSITVDLTNLIRAYGRDVLNDAAQGQLTLNAKDRAFYEAIGYYSELHIDIAYDKDGALGVPQMPNGAYSATNSNYIFSDWISQINTSVK